MHAKVKFSIAGFGFMGQTHCGNLFKNPSAEITGIIDPYDPVERLSSIRGNLQTVTITADNIRNIPHYTSIEQALIQAEADAVIVALPTRLHTEVVMKCLEAGKHVFVEKPMAISENECRLMNKTASEKNLLLAIGHIVRATSLYRYLHDTVKSGHMGKLKLLRMTRETGQPSWGNWLDPEFLKASGGALFDIVSHDLDFARFCLGEPQKIAAVKELCGNFNKNLLTAILYFRDTQVVITGGFVQPSSYPFYCGFSAFFEKGSLQGDCNGMLKWAYPDGTVENIKLPECDPYYDEVDAFIKALTNNADTVVCSGTDAAGTIHLCCEIARHIEEMN